MVRTLKLSGSLPEAMEQLNKLPEDLREVTRRILFNIMEYASNMAKIYCPVDTGTLRNSIRIEETTVGNTVGFRLVAGGRDYINPKTGRPCDYARMVEAKIPFMAPALYAVAPLVKQAIYEAVEASL